MRSTWKGSISFGLVNIPVAVYPATRDDKVSFKQLRKKDLSPIRYKKVAEADEKEVPADEIVRGYEYEKGKWVVLEDKDFEEVLIESTHTIEITDFISAEEVNPKFFYKPYFLEAHKGGDKAYSLLHRALVEIGKIGIAKVAIRSREYLAAIKPDDLFIMLELMHFANEILEPEGLKPASAELGTKEIAMAKALIDTMASEWQPARYKDVYQDAVLEMIDRKVKHVPVGAKAPKPAVGKDIPDILAILQQSISAGADKRKANGERGSKPKLTTKVRRGTAPAASAKGG